MYNRYTHNSMSSSTPMMSQYQKIKKEHPDSILLFRLGDFYEMFFEDAKTASRILGIALTSRNKSRDNPVPLCGVPFHSAEPYISKLLKSGNKVAICEQIEDPKTAKGIVKRKVVKVLTPGAILDSENLESKNNNYLASVYKNKNSIGVSFSDISTGEFKTTSFENMEGLISELSHLEPREILVSSVDEDLDKIDFCFDLNTRPLVTKIEPWKFEYENCRDVLLEFLNVKTLEPFEIENRPECIISSGVLLDYIHETQMDFTPLISSPKYYSVVDYLNIDDSTKRNLELFRSNGGDAEMHSLLWVMDQTKSAMGGRMLRSWINYPLIDIDKIKSRQDGISELKDKSVLREKLFESLKQISDIERVIGRISTTSARPRDLAALRDSSYFVKEMKALLSETESEVLNSLHYDIDDFQDLGELLSEAIVDEPPATSRDGGVIKQGFNEELDKLREIQKNGKKWISDLEIKEKKETKINSLKVGYNKVFGYYIEVTKTNLQLVPEHYIRKQTLTNGERFITPELKEFEEQITNAEEKILKIETDLFESVRQRIASQSSRVRKSSLQIAKVDVLCSLAEIAEKYNYVRPELTAETGISLEESRHPVIERIDLDNSFVPNDVYLDTDENQFIVITGPNMAGKSTLIRQVALLVLMAQTGSFIPARTARLGIFDRVFTRVGASDNLTRGQSTFMVEMVETAHILRNATERSLVILDEIGRGTSTFDGMSIAWAVSEYLHDIGCITLFATHYHELAQLAHSRRGVKNFNILVKESKDEIIFLRKFAEGATSHSYGIQVAKLAGVPNKVLNSARKILVSLEKLQSKLSESLSGEQFFLFDRISEDIEIETEQNTEISDEIRALDPMNMTPIEALNKLIELKDKAEK